MDKIAVLFQGSVIISEIIILGIAVGLLALEFNKSRREKEEEEKVLKADRETLRNKLYSLELAISKQEENILILARTALKRSQQMLGESPETLKEIVSSPPTSKDVIKPLELGKYNLSVLVVHWGHLILISNLLLLKS